MILLLTSPEDEHADHVAAMLRDRGADVVRFDPADFPSKARVTVTRSSDGPGTETLHLGDQRIELGALNAAWYRRPGRPTAAGVLTDPQVREFVEQESKAFLDDLWRSLDCRWFPALPTTVQEASRKGAQLKVASQLGFELPPTLITNSPDDVLEFHRVHDGQIVCKTAASRFLHTVGNEYVRYTELVSMRDLADSDGIAFCPLIFQALVPKRVELRVTVVGRRVFAAEIQSQVSRHTRLDWRRYDHGQTPHLPHRLPPELESRCVALTHALGLDYGAIDLVLTPDGRYVFLEINPNGQFLWIEEATGLPISDAICDRLIERPERALARVGGSR